MARTKEEQREYYRQWRAANKDKCQAYERERRQRQRADEGFKNKEWARHLRQRYGISGEQYQAMFDAQGGKCQLCGRTPGKIKLHTDHCHATGRVRGLLCHQCNWYMAKVDEDPGILDRIETYRRGSA